MVSGRDRSTASLRPYSLRSSVRAGIVLPPVVGVLFLVTLFLGSCVGKPQLLTKDLSALVFEEGSVYLNLRPSLDMRLTEKVLDAAGLDAESLRKILHRTEVIHAGFRTDPEGLSYRVIIQGSYPDNAAGLALKTNREWERVRRDFRWWEHRFSGLQLSFLGDDAIGISNGGIEEFLQRVTAGPQYELPDSVIDSMQSSAMTVYASEPVFPENVPPVFSSVLQLSMFFRKKMENPSRGGESEDAGPDKKVPDNVAVTNESMYLINGQYRCTEAAPARSLYLLLRLNLLSRAGNKDSRSYTNLLKEDPVSLSGDTVILENYPVDFEGLELFLSTAVPFTGQAAKKTQ